MTLRLGSLFTGYAGLDLAVEEAIGATLGEPVETVWVSDIDPGPAKVLAHRFPGVPNLGDITAINWSEVEHVELVAGGSPCQDISCSGRMAGMTPGSRSNLWVHMREAIRQLQPMFVVWENVQAARSTKAASRYLPDHLDRAIAHHLTVSKESHHGPTRQRHRRAALRLMESRTRRVGVAYPKPALRALGRVLGDLADLGFDAEWVSLPASGVGAPHLRKRYFVLAANARGQAWLQRRFATAGEAPSGRALGELAGRDRAPVALLPTPTTQDGANTLSGGVLRAICDRPAVVATLLPTPTVVERTNRSASPGAAIRPPLSDVVALLPTPRATDGTKGGPNQRGSSGDLMLPSAVMSLPHSTLINPDALIKLNEFGELELLPTPRATRGGSATETVDLLPTPSVADATGGHERRGGNRGDELLLKGIAAEQAWGPYEPAIRRWESIVGAAPAPTKPGKKGRPKLNPAFAEWMMGAAPGWITDVPGVTDNEALRMAGNGVVQQQAVAALRLLMARMAAWGEEAAA